MMKMKMTMGSTDVSDKFITTEHIKACKQCPRCCYLTLESTSYFLKLTQYPVCAVDSFRHYRLHKYLMNAVFTKLKYIKT